MSAQSSTYELLESPAGDRSNQEIDEVITDISFGKYTKARLTCSRLLLGFHPGESLKEWAKVIVEVIRLFIIIGNFSAALQTIHDVESLKEIPKDGLEQPQTQISDECSNISVDAEGEQTSSAAGQAGNSLEVSIDGDREIQEIDLVFELQTAFCKAMSDGRFHNLQIPFEKGLEWILQDEVETSKITRYTVLLLSYTTKLAAIAETYKFPSGPLRRGKNKESLTKVLRLFINKLKQCSRVDEAHILIRELNSLDPTAKLPNLLQLLDCWGLYDSPAKLADLHLDIAEAALAARQKGLAKSYAVLALVGYNSTNHLLGIKNTLYLQVKLTDDYDDSVVVKSGRVNFYAIKSLCDFYEQIGDRAGIQNIYVDWTEMARARADLDSYLILSDDLYYMTKQVGSNLTCLHTRVLQIAFFLSRTANTAKTLECIDAVLEDVAKLEIPYLQGLVASLASRTYLAMGRQKSALRFAEIALAKLRPCGPDSESGAKFQLVQCRKERVDNRSKPGDTHKPGRLANIIRDTEELIAVDLNGEMHSEAADKLLYLASLHYEEFDKSAETRSQSAIHALNRAIKCSSHLKPRESKYIFASAFQLRGAQILIIPGIPTPKEKGKSLKDLQKSLEYFGELNMWYQTAAVKQYMGLVLQNQSWRDQIDSLDCFEAAYLLYEKLGQTTECIAVSSLMLKICYNIWKRSGFSEQVSVGLLEALERTSKWLDYRRSELSALGGLQAIIEKQALARDSQVQNLGEIAFHYCVESRSAEQAWYWVQRQKARSVADLMGLGHASDEYSAKHKVESEQITTLLEEHTRLLSQIRDASPGNRLVLRATHSRLLDRMSRYAELKELINLQLGQPIDFSDLESIFSQDTGPQSYDIVLVDWFSTETDIYMISSRCGTPPRVSKLEKSIGYILERIANNFTDIEDRENTLDSDPDDPDAPFRELDFLISPLADFTRPGDLLVLAPCQPLHSIPLHALVLPTGGRSEILIKRNPVIYTPSLTIFKHCVSRAEKPREFRSEGIRCAAVYEYPPTQPFRAAEQAMIKSNIDNLGSLLNTKPLWGNNCTKEALRSHFNGASLLHFHGHCHYDSVNILNHSLVTSGVYNNLALGIRSLSSTKLIEDDKNTLSNRILFLGQKYEGLEFEYSIRPQNTGLSISEIFEVQLADPVVTIIACESASQQIGPGDEPLGLATAFLCAGASSYVGTIWEMPCEEARVFSTAFYENILSQKGARTVNLAFALQSAVLKVMSIPKSRNYMYWAPLVLHGSWFCQSGVFWKNK
ncbi:hypothetical protein TWF730_004222 [Orbilia blumenaviensis]|uniref:CHAT domain-containing protein n=1 Tax=Orbilia blumenaviensis TaxID=1796055 RepID=A0AAV9TZZ1_9PEZI